eukprot:scaffold54_cov110-Cylindrotheca_fusiformis.AAC.3
MYACWRIPCQQNWYLFVPSSNTTAKLTSPQLLEISTHAQSGVFAFRVRREKGVFAHLFGLLDETSILRNGGIKEVFPILRAKLGRAE